MDETKESKPKKVTLKKVKEVVKPRIPTKKYKLIKDVSIGGVIFKKGSDYPLTKEGKKYFKTQFYI
jgi:hypothetical protein